MNQQRTLKLVQTLILLKEKLKCPICLDVMQDVIELDCGHKYCEECYSEHKLIQNQVSCPLCKKLLKRRSMIYKDVYASALGKFVYNSCKSIRDVYNCEVELLRQTLSEESDPGQVDGSILNKNRTNPITRNLPTTSKTDNKRAQRSSSGKSCEDAFDKLMHAAQPTSTCNRKGTKRVYVNKKKLEEKPEIKFGVLEFDNCENKAAVLQWLNDTRNLFDRFTQTQNFETEHILPPIIDLASVSQEKENENNFKRVKIKKKCKWRARSLDIEIRKSVTKEAKRFSDGGGSVILENYNIEDINTEEEAVVKKAEEKVLLDLIEDEFLNKLENELQNCEDNIHLKPNKSLTKPPKHSNITSSAASSTGWDRMTKMKRSIHKSEKLPKQLNITLQANHHLTTKNEKEMIKQNLKSVENDVTPSNGSSKDFDNMDKLKKDKNVKNEDLEIVKQSKVGFLEKIDLTQNQQISNLKIPGSTESEKHILDKKPISYDFNALEDYITRNMKVIEKPLDSSNMSLSGSKLEKTLDKDTVESDVGKEYTEEVQKSNKLNPSPQSVTKKHFIEIQNNDDDDDDDVLLNMPTQIILNNIERTESKENIIFEHVVKITSGHNGEDISDKSNAAHQVSNTKLEEIIENKAVISDVDDVTNDIDVIHVPFNKKPGHNYQDITDTSNMQQSKSMKTSANDIVLINDDDDDDDVDLYALPTQKIKHICKDVTKSEENSYSTDGLLDLFTESLDKCLLYLKVPDIVNLEHHLTTLQSLTVKLKSLSKNNDSVNVTCTNNDKNKCAAATQTVVETAHEKVQTENLTINAVVQTEDIHCLKCNGNLKEVDEGAKLISQNTKNAMECMVNECVEQNTTLNNAKGNTPIAKSSSQNYVFTATFDNLDFETQEIAKNQGTISRNPLVKSDNNLRDNLGTQISEKVLSIGTDRKVVCENLPDSLLVCSFEATNPTCSKRAKKRLTYETDNSKRFKRIRKPTSDSDSEDETEAKRKCNRFIRDDLTIEIHTNTEKMNEQDQQLNSVLKSQDSDNINYDDYLAQVMKRYDEDNFSSNSCDKASNIPQSGKKVINHIITKCEKMIEHASKNIRNIKKINNGSCESSKDSFQTASQSINDNTDLALTADNMFMNEQNLLKLEKDIRDYEKGSIKEQNSEISDIIGGTEELEPLPKRPRNDIINDYNPQSTDLVGESENLVRMKYQLDNTNKICKQLNDSDEADFEIIEEQANLNKSSTPQREKIQIIGNIKIKSQDKKQEEEDLFSDEDIVETTPQKKVRSFEERSILSQIDNIADLPIKDNLPTLPSDTANFEFDFLALPPPPDFQDDSQPLDNNAADLLSINEDEASIPNVDTDINLNKSSLTPDQLSQFIIHGRKTNEYVSQIICSTVQNNKENQAQNNLSLTPDKLSQLNINPEPRKIHGSCRRDLSGRTLDISPIPAKKNQQSIIEMAQISKYTPLTSVTKYNTQKDTILTSTPRQKSIWNYIKSSQSNEKEATTFTKTKPCIACTRLTKEQIKSISQLTSKKLATYSSSFDPTVTHMIVAVNENNCVKDYTIKFVSAVAAGIWVLKYDWIEECLSNNCIIPEEPFEALDISGMPGPRTSRLTRKKNPLLKGYKFYCANPFISTTQQEVEEIIKMLEGKVLRDINGLLEDDGKVGLIIGEGHGTQDFEQYERWVELYRTVTVDIEWLSKCVGQYKLISIRPYVWCSEDNLGDLDYPSYLTEIVPLSFTETF